MARVHLGWALPAGTWRCCSFPSLRSAAGLLAHTFWCTDAHSTPGCAPLRTAAGSQHTPRNHFPRRLYLWPPAVPPRKDPGPLQRQGRPAFLRLPNGKGPHGGPIFLLSTNKTGHLPICLPAVLMASWARSVQIFCPFFYWIAFLI